MRNKILLFILLLVSSQAIYATHNRAGEITYEQIGMYSYKVTIVTFTNTASPADRPELPIEWGDGTTTIVDRIGIVMISDGIQKNTYKGEHTYPGPGIYQIRMEDPNRNEGVLNIPNSVNIRFAIQSTLIINPAIKNNNAPIMLNDPVDKAALNQRFVHNPNAYDANGDSLSYRIVTCLGDNGLPIKGYTRPPDNELWVNPLTGDLVWDKPTVVGVFNFAMAIDEWRFGVKIGTIIRDMQIEVRPSTNQPPVIDPLKDICVVAGDSISFEVIAHDSQDQIIKLSENGGPFESKTSPAKFRMIESKPGFAKGRFAWRTNCSHVRKYPYMVLFKAEDNGADLNLVQLASVNIRVISPGPTGVKLTPSSRMILVKWKLSACKEASSYHVYRRQNPSGYQPDSCTTGLPASTGYKLVAKLGAKDTLYLDNNNNKGLNQGHVYCYRIVAVFEDGAESMPSEEACTDLVRGIPAITKVSVEKTDETAGEIEIQWIKPTEFDKKKSPGPYKYVIFQADNLYGNGLKKIDSIMVSDTSKVFYSYRAKKLNTVKGPYSYSIVFYNADTANNSEIGRPEIASSPFIVLNPLDKRIKINLQQFVPWTVKDTVFVVYKQNQQTKLFDSVGFARDSFYVDRNLNNSINYCYKVKTLGHYDLPEIKEVFNWSQEACKMPVDVEPPCPLEWTIISDCANTDEIVLNWKPRENAECINDIKYYKVYFSPDKKTPLKVVQEITDLSITTYKIKPTESYAGCWAVTGVDSSDNEIKTIEPYCINNCFVYDLPNIFTPNRDGKNDLYKPIKIKYVAKVDFKVYNRWGVLVFETTDPNLNWDGKLKGSSSIVPDGVYYYICDVFQQDLSGMESVYKTGFISIYSMDNKKP
jgi:gliding motility-associated-like protein